MPVTDERKRFCRWYKAPYERSKPLCPSSRCFGSALHQSRPTACHDLPIPVADQSHWTWSSYVASTFRHRHEHDRPPPHTHSSPVSDDCSPFSSSFSFKRHPIYINHENKSAQQGEKGKFTQPREKKKTPMKTRSFGPTESPECQRAETGFGCKKSPISGVPPPDLYPTSLSASLPTVNCWEGCFCVLSASLFPCSGVLSHTLSFSLGWFNLTP